MMQMAFFEFFLLMTMVSPFAMGQGITAVRTQVALAYQLERLGINLDRDQSGVITSEEVFIDLDQNYDSNNDSCVTQAEWENRWIELGFTEDFAQYFYDVNSQQVVNNPECNGISVTELRNTPDAFTQPVEAYADNVLQSVIDMCEEQLILYTTNLDCISLPHTCQVAPFACGHTCQVYTFVTSEGRGYPFGPRGGGPFGFARNLRGYLQAADANSDGVVTGEEAQADYETNYDTNNDSCIDEMEFKVRMTLRSCGGFDFTEEFAQIRFTALRNEAASDECDGIDITSPVAVNLTGDDFNSANLQMLIDFCEENERRYNSNFDCLSLPRTCRGNGLSSLPTCQQYQETIGDRRAYPFQDANQIFREFVENFSNGTLPDDFIQS